MTDDKNDETSDRERRLYDLIGQYYAAVADGQEPDRGALIRTHPDLADSLHEFFLEQDRFHRATEPLRQMQDQPATEPPNGFPGLERGDKVSYFGDYELLGEIARGGMGVVYRARQRSLNRPVALKLILAGRHASDDDLQRFRNEAEAAANLDHPNIVPVYEVGEHEGFSYLALKLIEGPSLAQEASSRQLAAGRMSGGPRS
jgi:serine/threonine-protein kinase